MNRLEERFTTWAQRTPGQLAVDDGIEPLTYAELDQLANRFANRFRAAGVQPGDRVGVHMPRSGRAIAALLGAMRCGAAYVPLDPGSPPLRMRLIVQDCGMRHVVISPQLLTGWIAAGVVECVEHVFLSASAVTPELPATVTVHSFAELLASDHASSPTRTDVNESDPNGTDALAYILYTSGSTGVPKGVMLSHGNALAFVAWAAAQIELGPNDRVASVAPFHFDLSVFDLWSSLSCGASIIVVDEVTVLNGRRMLDRIRDHKISVWYSVPSALMLMLETGGLEERGAPSLRVVYFAGEVFPIKYLQRTMAALAQARFFNLFGPTETNVCLAYELREPPQPDAAAIPIGRASCGDEAFIVDEHGQPVADGEVGELFIEGPTVMLGYWDSGRRTPARHPYPTGDLVSRRADGELMYHGRRDHMVKVRGYRVELGEVEAAILRHSAVQEAIAFVVEQQLISVIVPANPTLSVLDIKRHLADLVPRYMIPSDIRLVQQLPRTSNGKIDRMGTKTAVLEGSASVLIPMRRDTE